LVAAVLRHRRAPRQRRTHLKQIRTLPADGRRYNLHFGGASALASRSFRTIAPPNCITTCRRKRLLRVFPRTCSKLSEWNASLGRFRCRAPGRVRKNMASLPPFDFDRARGDFSKSAPHRELSTARRSETSIRTGPRRADFQVRILNWRHQFFYCQTFDFCSILVRFPKQPMCLVTLAAINPANG